MVVFPTTLLVYCSVTYPQGLAIKYGLGGRLANSMTGWGDITPSTTSKFRLRCTALPALSSVLNNLVKSSFLYEVWFMVHLSLCHRFKSSWLLLLQHRGYWLSRVPFLLNCSQASTYWRHFVVTQTPGDLSGKIALHSSSLEIPKGVHYNSWAVMLQEKLLRDLLVSVLRHLSNKNSVPIYWIWSNTVAHLITKWIVLEAH